MARFADRLRAPWPARHGAMVSSVAGCVAGAVLLLACGADEEPVQTTAPAVTGAVVDGGEGRTPGAGGPEDEPDANPANDEAEIARTLETVLTATAVLDGCAELVTAEYVKRSFGDRSGCAGALDDPRPAEDVDVSEVVVLPDSVAQARVRTKGGLYSGERLRAVLVLDSGVWRLDSLRSNVPVGP